MTHSIGPDQERLHEYLASAQLRGRPINHKTARELARWFADAIGPGFETFLATGTVTGPLYTELARLYDMRQTEVERWLDNLTRFVVAQPLVTHRRRQKPETDQ